MVKFVDEAVGDVVVEVLGGVVSGVVVGCVVDGKLFMFLPMMLLVGLLAMLFLVTLIGCVVL